MSTSIEVTLDMFYVASMDSGLLFSYVRKQPADK